MTEENSKNMSKKDIGGFDSSYCHPFGCSMCDEPQYNGCWDDKNG